MRPHDTWLWVDDERMPPTAYGVWARTFGAAATLMAHQRFDVVSLDHDLGDPESTGYTLATLIERELVRRPDALRCHSQNPVGRARIEQVIAAIYGR